MSKPSHPTTESNQAQHSVMASSTAAEKPRSDVYGEVAAHDDEGNPLLCAKHLNFVHDLALMHCLLTQTILLIKLESKSVYVGNVPSSVSEADLENEFKKFGRLIPDGVAIRSRKVCS